MHVSVSCQKEDYSPTLQRIGLKYTWAFSIVLFEGRLRGRTTDFDSVNTGSMPVLQANIAGVKAG